ncbi:MAG: hypothetical protein K2M17_00090 [Bacilli bacterium]|nr:hypothetical protein [Bacilli bacterium]
MAVEYGFFPSKNNDRTYDGYDLGGIFEGIILEGVFREFGYALEVMENTSNRKTVRVRPGKAWIKNTFLKVTQDETVTFDHLDKSDSAYVIIEHDKDLRMNRLSAISVNTLITDMDIFILAEIGFSSNGDIYQSNIINYRGTYRCPFITGIQKTLSADDILRQWTTQFQVFMTNSQVEFQKFIERDAKTLIGNTVREEWAFLERILTNKFNIWYNRNTTDFTNQWNEWFLINTTIFKNDWDSWYATNTTAFKKQWMDWYYTNTEIFERMWYSWYNDKIPEFQNKMATFEATWDIWWHEMTDGKKEELEEYWKYHQERLTSLMIKQWWEWYHPFVDEKEAEFADWKLNYQYKIEQIDDNFHSFVTYVEDKTMEVDAKVVDFEDYVDDKELVVDERVNDFKEFVDDEEQEVTDVKEDFKAYSHEQQKKIDKETFDAIKKIKKEIEDFYNQVGALGFFTLPFINDINDSDGDVILDSDSKPLLSINYVLVL